MGDELGAALERTAQLRNGNWPLCIFRIHIDEVLYDDFGEFSGLALGLFIIVVELTSNEEAFAFAQIAEQSDEGLAPSYAIVPTGFFDFFAVLHFFTAVFGKGEIYIGGSVPGYTFFRKCS